MNGKKTLIIALVCAVVLGGYLWDQHRHKAVEERKQAESRLIAPKAETLDGITLVNNLQKTPAGGSTTIQLEKQNDHWMMTQPAQAHADQAAVESILTQIEQAKRDNEFKAEAGRAADYGLENPVATISFSTTDTTKIPDLKVGARTPDGLGVYAQFEGRDDVFTLGEGLARSLTSTPVQLRDKRLVPAAVADATRLTLAFDGQSVTAEKQAEDQWQLTQPAVGKADAAAITDILGSWNSAQTSDFIDTGTQQLADYGLDTPVVTASVFVEGDEGAREYKMMVGDLLTTNAPRLAHYAMREGSPTVFTVSDDLVKKLRPTLDTLRDKELFTIAAEDVGRASFRMLRHSAPVERGPEGKWRFSDEPETPLDQTLVNNKIDALASLKAVRFFTNDLSTSVTGLEAPNVIATLGSKDGLTTETIETGRKAEDGDFVYTRFTGKDGTSRIVGVDWRKPGDFFITREDLLDKKIVRFNADDVKKIHLYDRNSTITLTQTGGGGGWEGDALITGREGAAKFNLDGATVNGLLYNMEGLEWKRRLERERPADLVQIKTMRLENPPREIVIYGPQDTRLGSIGIGESNENNSYVRSDDGNYVVDQFRLRSLLEAMATIWSPAGAPFDPNELIPQHSTMPTEQPIQ